jgi:glucose/arabinose dehydrogenase
MKYYLMIALWLGIHSFSWAQEHDATIDNIKVVFIAKGLEHPWSMAFLPDKKILVTERPGRFRIITSNGQISAPLKNMPKIYAQGQGGLLDVILDPQFHKSNIIYFSYAEGVADKAGTVVAKAVLKEDRLENVQVIFRQTPKVEGDNHWGSRLVFSSDDKLFITLGERFGYANKAQDLSNHLGKVIRINADGSIPNDNPYINLSNIRPEIWSYGHRNSQGGVINPYTKELWMAEHGPKGGDEINIIKAGANYGWPKASYGSHYSNRDIPDTHKAQGFEEPYYSWNPSISPSGMIFYTANKFPKWQGDLFLGSLSEMCLIRLDIENGKVIKEERLLKDLDERIRDVRQGPDGFIYLLTDNDNGRILRLEPK